MADTFELAKIASLYASSGLSVIPVTKEKIPAIKEWKPFQERIMVNGEILENFQKGNAHSIAIICGRISGNLEAIDVDCKYDLTGNLWTNFKLLIEDNLPDLYPDLAIQKTKNGGYHILYRCQEIEGNQKIAQRLTTDQEKETKNDKIRVLIETRGEGGYILADPSDGYHFIQKSAECIPNISSSEREILIEIARTFDQIPKTEHAQEANNNDELSTFDDYNQRADVINLLIKHGWTISRKNEEHVLLTRPGKTKGISGTYFKKNKIFYVFSTSTDLDAQKGLNPTQLYSFLECNGNFSEASRKLYAEGFGTRRTQEKTEEPEKPIQLFPIEGFPLRIQKFINTCADTYRTPRDFWAGAVLISVALAIGNKLRLKDKYSNVPILWLAIVGDVSTGKTEPLDLCLGWFKRQDSKSIEEYNKAFKEYEAAMSLPAKERDKTEKPSCFQYRLIDFTPEYINIAHSANKRGLIIERDELKGWIDDFNRYNKSGEQSNMLSSWFEIDWITNRKTGLVALNIPKPCIFVTGGIQPDLLSNLARDERAESGFLSRMCFIFPDNVKKQPYNEAILPRTLYLDFEKMLADLAEMESETTLTLSSNATEYYRNWYNKNATISNNEAKGYLKGVYGKLDVICLRIAIILRGMNLIVEGDYSDRISGEEMLKAIEITEYFRATALKVFKRIFQNKESIPQLNNRDVARYLISEMQLSKHQVSRTLRKDVKQIRRWAKEK